MINYKGLVRDFKLLEAQEPHRGPRPGKGGRFIREAMKERVFTPHDLDLGRLFEECFGFGAFKDGRSGESALALMEAAGATSSNAFQQISGQFLFSTTMQNYESEQFVFTKMIPTRNSPFLTGEKIPGISNLGDEATVVNELEEFPLAGVSENYIETPDPRKRGLRIAVSREAIFGDRTGLLVTNVSKLSESLGINQEKRAIDCVIDEGAGASADVNSHRYKWRGDLMATYGNNTGTHSFDNLETGNALLNHTSIDLMEQLFAGMTDPDTGEPISVFADTLIVAPGLTGTAWRVLNAMMVSLQAGGFATSGNLYRTDFSNPVGKTEFSAPYKLMTSRLLGTRMTIPTSWYLGSPSKAFVWMENWPMRMLSAPAMSEDEFKRDIVLQHRIDRRGAYATIEPRLMAKATVA